MSQKTPHISIVIPAYNEELRLPASIAKLKQYLDAYHCTSEVIIVIEKSQDATVEAAAAAVGTDTRFTLIKNKTQKGKGFAVRSGVMAAQGELIFFMDADLSTGLEAIATFEQYFDNHPETDLIIGSREHKKSRLEKAQNPFRRTMGKAFNTVVQKLVIAGVKDTQCGFKAFRHDVAKQLFSMQTINGFAFDIELLALADRFHYNMHVLPVVWTNSPASKVRVVRDSIKMFLDIWKVKYRLAQLPAEQFHKHSN